MTGATVPTVADLMTALELLSRARTVRIADLHPDALDYTIRLLESLEHRVEQSLVRIGEVLDAARG
jgi:hypothetical protein